MIHYQRHQNAVTKHAFLFFRQQLVKFNSLQIHMQEIGFIFYKKYNKICIENPELCLEIFSKSWGYFFVKKWQNLMICKSIDQINELDFTGIAQENKKTLLYAHCKYDFSSQRSVKFLIYCCLHSCACCPGLTFEGSKSGSSSSSSPSSPSSSSSSSSSNSSSSRASPVKKRTALGMILSRI